MFYVEKKTSQLRGFEITQKSSKPSTIHVQRSHVGFMFRMIASVQALKSYVGNIPQKPFKRMTYINFLLPAIT